ncbi:MAG: hypothetical protein DI586_10665 [Micavibrio aeruginosavorus]|uniref:Tryptophan synthase beta chain-like PALP domain-containing protein n=1 Tax=Micavibrio aeruginosavorus TaxID=349221 RepID=A0A2W5FJ64_9BACT|nr:MAG: hypothetical protein DI586_10665 [Micavibrio aeruginosavorus]
MPLIPAAKFTFVQGFAVLDDSEYGTKARMAEKIIGKSLSEEFYFAATHFGDSPRAIGQVCKHYNKKAKIFYPQIHKEDYTPIMKQTESLGVQIEVIDSEDFADVIAATDTAAERDKNGERISFRGLSSIEVVAETVREAISASAMPEPDYFFSASSTGSMAKGLQLACPKADHHAVRVMNAENADFGKAHIHEASLEIIKFVNGLPPLNTSFEAAAWPVMLDWSRRNPHIPRESICFWFPAKSFG